MVKRRQFIALIGGAALFPSVARAQQRMRVIGVLTANVETDPDAQARVRAFRESLAARWDAADDEVQDDLRFEIRWPGPDASLQRRYAEELASLSADLGQQLRVAVVAISAFVGPARSQPRWRSSPVQAARD